MKACMKASKGSPSWFLDDKLLEKMGAIMQDNNWKILALYDEFSMFPSECV